MKTMAISEEQLAAWERLAQQATLGPWYATVDTAVEDPDPADDIWTVGPLADDENWQTDSGYPGYGLRYVDAAFCAEARTMVPALLAEVRRLRAEVPHA